MKNVLSLALALAQPVPKGTFTNLLAFQNPDKSVVLAAHNHHGTDQPARFRVGGRLVAPVLKAPSFNILFL
jgi:glucosylceramidase